MILAERARQDEADLALAEHVRRTVPQPGLGPGVRDAREAERVLVEVRGLLRVTHPELDVVPTVERHEIAHLFSV